jgi:Cu2+-exporting ATPase
VIGGSINGPGALRIEVTKTGDDTAISQMARLVLEAQEGKPRVQRQADLAAHWLTIVAIVVGVGTLLFWSLVAGDPFVAALTLAITVVVIACPHALGLAIPMVTTISTTLAARSGMLIKSAEALEVARQVDVVVFDKTGTLTKGEFGVTGIVSSNGWTDDQVLAHAAAVEATSEHPIARGVLRSADERQLTYQPAANFRAIPGKGAQAEVEGEIVHAGTAALMSEIDAAIDGVGDAVERIAEGGKTLVYLAHQGKVRGVLALADIVREESREAVRNLSALGIETAMLTGDNRGIAAAVGRELSLSTVIAEVLPGDKADKIRELQRGGRRVAMVGDGVNDAPALAQADVGIAIGAGTDVAIESADIVLMKNDPRDLVKLVRLSRATVTKMRQNLVWATGYNVVAIPLAAGVAAPVGLTLRPEWGALLMAASSIIVALNALLLRRTDLSGR